MSRALYRFFSKAYKNSVGLVVQKIQDQFNNNNSPSGVQQESGTDVANVRNTNGNEGVAVTLGPPALDLSSHLRSLRDNQSHSSDRSNHVAGGQNENMVCRGGSSEDKDMAGNDHDHDTDDDAAILLSFDEEGDHCDEDGAADRSRKSRSSILTVEL